VASKSIPLGAEQKDWKKNEKEMQRPANESVTIRIDSTTLHGDLVTPRSDKSSLIIFAHGSGSSRLSPRNRYVAEVLQGSGFGTLLFDLLTEKEDENYETRFDIDLLTERLVGATSWARHNIRAHLLRLGYFGASTGAAAALRAAADLGQGEVNAVVSRGGRPDMAGQYLVRVQVPTLLIVGGSDEAVLELNRSALVMIGSQKKKLIVVPRATHLFEEPGTLAQVAKHASNWFEEYL
jgi:putative phosphoribosyl transferase